MESGIQEVESGMQGVEFGIQEVESGIHGVESGIQRVESRIQGVKSRILAMKSRIYQRNMEFQGMESGRQEVNPGSGIWNPKTTWITSHGANLHALPIYFLVVSCHMIV